MQFMDQWTEGRYRSIADEASKIEADRKRNTKLTADAKRAAAYRKLQEKRMAEARKRGHEAARESRASNRKAA